mgnify:CR=1 FL=1
MADFNWSNAPVNYELFAKDVPRNQLERDLIVLVDTREALPWTFDYPTQQEALKAGDYSIALKIGGRVRQFHRRFAVERKATPDDLLTCFTHDRERFKKELCRLQRCDIAAVICDFDLETFLDAVSKRAVEPASMWHTLLAFQAYFRIPFILAPSEEMAKDAFITLARCYIRSRILGKA